MNEDTIRIEVAYAKPEEQVVVSLEVALGTTLASAIEQSGLLDRFPEIDAARDPIGVFGRICPREQELRAGDRVEIYRPLNADPKLVRRQRARRRTAEPRRS